MDEKLFKKYYPHGIGHWMGLDVHDEAPYKDEKGNEIPLQSRILAIADLFEALTAADRPYKKGKTLTETLKIMAYMAKDHEIDKNLLNLLIDSGIIIEYAKKYLKPEQIDKVDFEKIKKIYN